MQGKRIFMGLMLIILFMLAGAASAQTEGYLYGKISLRNGNVYEGPIRWGKEEAFWMDLFNSNKDEDIFEAYLEDCDGYRDLRRELRDQSRERRVRFNRGVIINLGNGGTSHSFKCRFGDIQMLDFRGQEGVRLVMKNGETLRLSGGSNDVGTTLKIMDPELDEMEIRWRSIDTIEFLPTPGNLKEVFGEPLYGTVKSDAGTFTGFIQWDNEECVSEDVLDGEGDEGDMKIRFESIKSIEKYRRGSKVTLHSGREYYLTGSNDVNSENRGIVVKDPLLGQVKIGWRDFESLVFEKSKDSGMRFADFAKTRSLEGTVVTEDGETVQGRLFYDLDECWDLEMLDGQDGATEYMIPFRSIKRIVPDGRWGSEVTLTDGRTLVLEESRDIDEDNAGLVVQSGKTLRYIEWRDIKEIKL